MNPATVLVLGAHPDDEMGAAGLIARLATGGSVVDALAFSDCADAIPAGFTADDLEAEYTVATAFIGCRTSRIGDIPNRNFPQYRQDIIEDLDRLRGKYDLVLVPATSDAHQDHHVVTEEAIRVFKHSTILGYDLPMNTVGPSLRNLYVRLEPWLVELKVEHAAMYLTQKVRPYMDESFIRGTAAHRGIQAGCAAAEAFEVIRWVW